MRLVLQVTPVLLRPLAHSLQGIHHDATVAASSVEMKVRLDHGLQLDNTRHGVAGHSKSVLQLGQASTIWLIVYTTKSSWYHPSPQFPSQSGVKLELGLVLKVMSISTMSYLGHIIDSHFMIQIFQGRNIIDLYVVAHAAGWEPYIRHDLEHDSVLHRSCITYHYGRLWSRLSSFRSWSVWRVNHFVEVRSILSFSHRHAR